MVKKLQKDPSLLKLGGDTKDMTFLFCDIRGFTPVSEQYKTNPQGLTELVNRFLTPMTDVIMLKGGTIDKYMGDCIMAFWNAPLDVKNHRQLAIETALRMQDKLKILNLELANEKKLPINIGIGINSGEVVVGNMGSNQRFDYSVLGDAVNLAARLEGQSKSYGVKLIVGEDSTKDCIDQFNFIPLDTIAVKGKTEPVNIYTVMKTNDDTYRMKNSMTEAIGQYKLHKWKIAQKLFRSIKISHPELAIVSQLYINRCELYSKAPSPKDWDGTFIAQTK
jgi:adenylate cyclase